jgi:hypothetical protein
MQLHKLGFSGAILERGFWLYSWCIRCGAREVFYVGRTGDSSSHNAASPFSRLSQHLDMRPKATANMLLRHVKNLGLDPLACTFELHAFGPMFPEQPTLELHRQYRDRVASLETALADYLRSTGREVVGSHGTKGKVDHILYAEIERAFSEAMNSGR